MSSIKTAKPTSLQRKQKMAKITKYTSAYIMLLPAILIVFALSYVPMAGIIIAFKEYNADALVMGMKKYGVIGTILNAPWVGLDNFKEIFVRPEMVSTIGRTFFYGCVFVFGGFPFPIILALLFNEIRNVKFKKVTQTITYMPHFLSMVSVVGMVTGFLAAEGPVNQLLNSLGMGEGYTNPLFDAKYFLPIIFVANLWKAVGWASIVYLAAITGIDPTLYEAAEVDGCGKFKQVLKITIPCIAETMIILLIMELGKITNTNFELVQGFQNAFIEDETDIISTYIYRKGVSGGEYDVSTAFGLAQGAVNLLLVLSANAISKKVSGAGIW